jgi:hypothetical protein
VNCLNPVISGVTTDGGYAEVMIAEARALALIPEELNSVDAAPLVCAGITTYNALRNAGLSAQGISLPSWESAALVTSEFSLLIKWASGRLHSPAALRKSLSPNGLERTLTSTPKLKTALQP